LRARLDWPDGALLRFRVAVSHEGSARPIEVLTALFGEELAADAEIARSALWAEGGLDPLELAPLRSPRLAGATSSVAPAAP